MHTFVKQEQTVMIKTGNWMKRQIICFEKLKMVKALYRHTIRNILRGNTFI